MSFPKWGAEYVEGSGDLVCSKKAGDFVLNLGSKLNYNLCARTYNYLLSPLPFQVLAQQSKDSTGTLIKSWTTHKSTTPFTAGEDSMDTQHGHPRSWARLLWLHCKATTRAHNSDPIKTVAARAIYFSCYLCSILFLHPAIYLSTYPSIHPGIYQSI